MAFNTNWLVVSNLWKKKIINWDGEIPHSNGKIRVMFESPPTSQQYDNFLLKHMWPRVAETGPGHPLDKLCRWLAVEPVGSSRWSHDKMAGLRFTLEIPMSYWSGWWLTYPSEKYEFVNWDDDIPNSNGKIKNVPNHQPVMDERGGTPMTHDISWLL